MLLRLTFKFKLFYRVKLISSTTHYRLFTTMISERLLQFIWQFQYFNRQLLKTTAGEDLEILSAGTLNKDQGPDFRQSRIKINNVLWAGDVELHLLSSTWRQHRHHTDEAYNKVVLHVVFRNDRTIVDHYGNMMPTLELEDRIPSMLLQRYHHWMNLPQTIPCQADIQQVSGITWQSWKERLLVERLQTKTEHIQLLLKQTGGHWEQVCWLLTCRYFAGPVNAESFEQIAASVPVNLLAKHKLQLHQLEALLLGQAGFLKEIFTTHYPLLLQKEYHFLQAKYKLAKVAKPPVFLRMRPVNFPTLRLAQLAMLVHQSVHLFSKIIDTATIDELAGLFNVTASAFWNTHFKLNESSATDQPKKTGQQLINTLLINVVAPLVFAYGRYVNDLALCDRALLLLEQVMPEKNAVINIFSQLNIDNTNAYTSQALLHLRKHYCNEKRCLECAVGNAILKRS